VIEVVSSLIILCLSGSHVCTRDQVTPTAYYQAGKSCYIEGTFYKSCPSSKVRETPPATP